MYLALFPALRNGFSIRPAPETIPIIALHFGFNVANFPDGNFTDTPCAVWENTMADDPADFTSFPPSPMFLSRLQISVPSGIDSRAKILFGLKSTLFPI